MKIETFGNATLYLGDCREILPTLGKVDAVVTDPPYGIDFQYATHDDGHEKWHELMDHVVPMCRAVAQFVIMPCCAIARLPWWYKNHPPDWIVAWYKGSPGHCSAIGFNDWEPHLVWGRPKHPMHDYFSTQCGFDLNNDHPCPKPDDYAMWLVSRSAPRSGIICDPFMGSGTTGIACGKLGRRFIGIEIDSKYFDIACRRIEKKSKNQYLFNEPNPKTKQALLFDVGKKKRV